MERRKKEEIETDRDRSRKRRASKESSRSPSSSSKKPRDRSPGALSAHRLSPLRRGGREKDGSPAGSINSRRSGRDRDTSRGDRGDRGDRVSDRSDSRSDKGSDGRTDKGSDVRSEKLDITPSLEKGQVKIVEKLAEKEKEADAVSEKGSIAGSERSLRADSVRSHLSRARGREPDKRSRKGSDAGDLQESEKKRSRSGSVDGSESGDSKRRKVDVYPEGEGHLAGYVIKDTIGSDKEDGGNFESIEQNFSDWSDIDSDDDILNQPGEPSPPAQEKTDTAESEEKVDPVPSQDIIMSSPADKDKEEKESQETAEEMKDKETEEDDVDELESISSDEGTLLGHVKAAAVDALKIDWASLVKDSRPKPSTGSALERFKPGNLFARIGLSRQFAGPDLFNEVLEVCQRQQEVTEKSTSDVEQSCVKTAESSVDENNGANTTPSVTSSAKTVGDSLTENTKTSSEMPSSKFSFLSDVAVFHSATLQKLKDRRKLMSDIGPFRQALCARRDLEIRRQLCKVDTVLDQPQMYTSQDVDSELLRCSVQMLKQARQPSSNNLENSTCNVDSVSAPSAGPYGEAGADNSLVKLEVSSA